MTQAVSAHLLPDLLALLRQHVSEDMRSDDVTARELVEHLDMAWCADERWRIESAPGFLSGDC